jgi:hypothetical protein
MSAEASYTPTQHSSSTQHYVELDPKLYYPEISPAYGPPVCRVRAVGITRCRRSGSQAAITSGCCDARRSTVGAGHSVAYVA